MACIQAYQHLVPGTGHFLLAGIDLERPRCRSGSQEHSVRCRRLESCAMNHGHSSPSAASSAGTHAFAATFLSAVRASLYAVSILESLSIFADASQSPLKNCSPSRQAETHRFPSSFRPSPQTGTHALPSTRSLSSHNGIHRPSW